MRNLKNLFTFTHVPYVNIQKDLKEQKSLSRVADDVPFVGIFKENSTLITKNNSLVQIIRIKGMSLMSSSRDEQREILKEKRRVLESLDERFEYSFLYLHRKNQEEFAQKKSKDELTNKILKKWESEFANIYQTEIYLVIISGGTTTIKQTTKSKEDLITRYASLSNHTLNLTETLFRFKSHKCKGEELLKVYDYILNPYEEELKKHIFKYKQTADLNVLYSRSDIECFNTGLIKHSSDTEQRFSKIISIKTLPQETTLEMLDSLFREKIDFLMINNVVPLTEDQARATIKSNLDQQNILSFMTDEREEDSLDAMKSLGEGVELFYDYDFSIQIYADSKEELERNIAKISGQLQRKGLIGIIETSGARIKYISFLPDTFHVSQRKELVSVGNITDIINMSSSSKGLTKCAWGDTPIVHLKTTRGSDYAFTFHIDESDTAQGNTLIIGATGTGKSMITSFLLMNALNQFPDLRILGFDSKLGLKTPTSFFGGKHFRYGEGETFGLNPFQLDDTQETRIFLKQFIGMLAGGIEEYEEEIVEFAIKNAFREEKQDRGLIDVMGANLFFQDKDQSRTRKPIHDRMLQWIPDQKGDLNTRINGMLFNAKEDALDFRNPLVVYDMEVALQSPELIPIASYIFHKFRTLVEPKGIPHIVLMDEMASYFTNESFVNFAKKHIMEARKKKGVFVGLLQGVSSIMQDEKLGGQILNNIGTLILFPNPKISQDDKRYMNLSDSEYEWIRNEGGSREIMVKKENHETVILDINLLGLGEYRKAFSSDVNILNNLNSLMGKKDWRNLLIRGQNA